MLTPEQQQLYSGTLGQSGPAFQQAYSQFLQPMDLGAQQDIFQQAYVNPAMQAYQQQILPAIQERYADANAGSSSALNQALAQSAQDLSTSLGSQFGQFYQQQQANQLAALGGFQNLLSQQTFSPLIQERQGILPGVLEMIGQIVAAKVKGGS